MPADGTTPLRERPAWRALERHHADLAPRHLRVHVRDASVIALIPPLGALAGVVVANSVPERALEVGFAVLLAVVAVQLAQRSLRSHRFNDPASNKLRV